jgi:hypothetical protein
MTTAFKQNGINYVLLTAPRGRTEPVFEAVGASAASVWASERQKHKLTGGLDRPERERAVRIKEVDGAHRANRQERRPIPKEDFLQDADLD